MDQDENTHRLKHHVVDAQNIPTNLHRKKSWCQAKSLSPQLLMSIKLQQTDNCLQKSAKWSYPPFRCPTKTHPRHLPPRKAWHSATPCGGSSIPLGQNNSLCFLKRKIAQALRSQQNSQSVWQQWPSYPVFQPARERYCPSSAHAKDRSVAPRRHRDQPAHCPLARPLK